jgi:hypothetical protein
MNEQLEESHTLRFIGSGMPQPVIGFRQSSRGITYSIPDERPAQDTVEVTVGPLADIQARGPEFARMVASTVMVLVGTEVNPISGVAEAASILGVKKQRVSQLYKQGKMPDMVEHLRSGPIWLTKDLVVYALTRPRQTVRANYS